jgi:hypothetical protein
MGRRSNSYNGIHVSQVWSALYVVRATSGKFGLYPGHMQAITQNEEWISIRIILGIIVPVCFSIHNIQQKYSDNNRKIL